MRLVLGTGRSGTSTIARLLRDNLYTNMGKYFRDPDQLNPQGYFEDLEFRNINIALLRGDKGQQEKLHQLITQKNKCPLAGQSKLAWGIKDPRIPQLWEYYQQYIDDDTKIIVATRDFEQIIKSMMHCYNWTRQDSINLMLARLYGINQLINNRTVLTIDFSIKRNDEELIDVLSNFLGQSNGKD